MPSTTFGNPFMDLRDLVRALLSFDALAARQWLADAQRSGFVWAEVPAPVGLDTTELATAAGVAELLAARAGQPPPGWAASVPAGAAKALPRPCRVEHAAPAVPLRARRPRAAETPGAPGSAGISEHRLADLVRSWEAAPELA